jgi:hypothetical protein
MTTGRHISAGKSRRNRQLWKIGETKRLGQDIRLDFRRYVRMWAVCIVTEKDRIARFCDDGGEQRGSKRRNVTVRQPAAPLGRAALSPNWLTETRCNRLKPWGGGLWNVTSSRECGASSAVWLLHFTRHLSGRGLHVSCESSWKSTPSTRKSRFN